MMDYESSKEKTMKAFEELIGEAGVYSYAKTELKAELGKLLEHLDACRAYSHPGMK